MVDSPVMRVKRCQVPKAKPTQPSASVSLLTHIILVTENDRTNAAASEGLLR